MPIELDVPLTAGMFINYIAYTKCAMKSNAQESITPLLVIRNVPKQSGIGIAEPGVPCVVLPGNDAATGL